jgi:hypothetical protein
MLPEMNTPPAEAETFESVTMGHLRGHGVTRLLVYCTSGWCHHVATLEPDWLPDDVRLLALRPRMVCTRCGLVGADVRPDWSQGSEGRGSGGAHLR